MTLLLYDYYELEERASRHLNVWKAWHIILYVMAAIFGILNYIFLQKTMQLVDNNCVLYPRTLEFHDVELPIFNYVSDNENMIVSKETKEIVEDTTVTNVPVTVSVPSDAQNNTRIAFKRDVAKKLYHDTAVVENKTTVITDNGTHRTMLDTYRTIFGDASTCQFAEYMPIMSTILAIVWITLFTMCPSGGHTRSGLTQPWRILTPALIFALVLVGLTGHSFTSTNGGLQAFCSAFYNITNATTCSSVNPYLELGWNVSWSMGGRAAATRAASAGVWASWACAAALLMARCLAAPDFAVRRTGVYLKDPEQKIIPHLKRSPRRSPRSPLASPTLRDNESVRSEPTITTELVTASVEHGQESAPSSMLATPRHEQRGYILEMTHSPHELNGLR